MMCPFTKDNLKYDANEYFELLADNPSNTQ